MNILEIEKKLKKIFIESLAIDPNVIIDSLIYAEFPEWDSVAHMTLVASIEEGFDIMINAEDVIDMSSFENAVKIVSKYLN